MLIKQHPLLKNALNKSKLPTHICKICFCDIKNNTFWSLFNKEVPVCHKCLEKFKPVFSIFNIDGLKGLYLYNYDDEIKETLFQVKGCYDYELSKVFLAPFLHELKIRYAGYYLVCAPSSKEDDQARGFNHISAIFSSLNFEELHLLKKKERYKQSDQHFENRNRIKEIITLKEKIDLSGKKILLVDDVLTTGNTLHACYELIRTLHPKKIKILVVSKTTEK